MRRPGGQPGNPIRRLAVVDRTDNPELRKLIETALTRLVPLGGHLGIEVEGAGTRWVRVTMPFDAAVANHVGNVYAGASYCFLELCGGAIMAASLPLRWVPVIVAAQVEYPKAARSGLVFDHEMPEETAEAIVAGLESDRRHAPEYTLEATDEDGVVVIRGRFTYRYLRIEGS